MFPAGNGGTIELVYTQIFAPATLAPARDFWTLRYTSLENGSLMVCERSLSGSGVGPNPASATQFVRGEILPSGYLIRPCEGGGSIIHIVDHLNLEAWSVPEVLRPLYESSKVVAQKMTIAALRYIRQIAQEPSGEIVYGLGRQPAVLRTLSQMRENMVVKLLFKLFNPVPILLNSMIVICILVLLRYNLVPVLFSKLQVWSIL